MAWEPCPQPLRRRCFAVLSEEGQNTEVLCTEGERGKMSFFFFSLDTGAAEGEVLLLVWIWSKIVGTKNSCIQTASWCRMRSELGACGLTKLSNIMKTCQPRTYVAPSVRISRDKGRTKGHGKYSSFRSWLKLTLAKLHGPCPYGIYLMDKQIASVPGGSCQSHFASTLSTFLNSIFCFNLQII